MGLSDFLARTIVGDSPAATPTRTDPSLGFDEWVQMITQFVFNGVQYTIPTQTQEKLDGTYPIMSRGAFKANGVVYACVANRMDLFSEAKFTFQRLRSAGPSGFFSNPDLRILDKPWENATTGDLLSRMLLYHDIAGNAYVVRRGSRLVVLRPDWVTIIGGIPGNKDATVWHPDARVLGYSYQEGGPNSGKDPIIFLPEEVAHFASRPDPDARFRGLSWLTPVIREIMGDKAMVEHKLRFLENAATPNLIVKLDVNDLAIYEKWREKFREEHSGVRNAYKTMFLGAGADATVVGSNLAELDFKVVQGAGETRIAAAAGVPPVVVGLSEGLAAATYSNYAQARRRFADQTMRPLWRNVAGSLASIINVPPDAQLWYDDRNIAALSEDQKDIAAIQQQQAQSIKTLIDSGFDPDSAITAIQGNDLSVLTGQHSGLYSVQLQPAGSVSEGKGSLLQGSVVPAQQPQAPAGKKPAAELPSPPQREMSLDLEMPQINIQVHPPEVSVQPPNVDIHVDAPELPTPANPEITVHVDREEPRPKRKRVELPGGKRATVTEHDGETEVAFDDGHSYSVKDLDEVEDE